MASMTLRRAAVLGAVVILLGAMLIVAAQAFRPGEQRGLTRAAQELLAEGDRDFHESTQGDARGGAGAGWNYGGHVSAARPHFERPQSQNSSTAHRSLSGKRRWLCRTTDTGRRRT